MTFAERLDDETDKWVAEDIISAQQASAIRQYYEDRDGSVTSSRLISVILTIGSVLVGLGAIVFVASNWQAVPAVLKLLLLFGTTGITYVAGWYFGHMDRRYPLIGRSLLFLGSLFTGATIFLTAQIFNVPAWSHWLMLLWFVAVFPLSYGMDSKPILVLSNILFGWWLVMALEPFDGSGTVDVFLFYGLALYAVGLAHEESLFDEYSPVYKVSGVLYTLSVLYVFVGSELDAVEALAGIYAHWVTHIFVLLALGAMVYAWVGRKQQDRAELLWLLVASLASVFLWIMGAGNMVAVSAVPWLIGTIIVVFNLCYAVLVLLTVLLGYRDRMRGYVNLGLLFFVLYIGYLYVTTAVSYLDRSLALIIGGVVLLAGGWWLEKKRSALLEAMEDG